MAQFSVLISPNAKQSIIVSNIHSYETDNKTELTVHHTKNIIKKKLTEKW